MTLICIVIEKQEYIIPYAERAEMYQAINKWSGLYNGKVYTMSKFMREINRFFDEKSRLEGDGDLIGDKMPIQEGIYVEPWMAAVLVGRFDRDLYYLHDQKETNFFEGFL